jgi:hypothetical protein
VRFATRLRGAGAPDAPDALAERVRAAFGLGAAWGSTAASVSTASAALGSGTLAARRLPAGTGAPLAFFAAGGACSLGSSTPLRFAPVASAAFFASAPAPSARAPVRGCVFSLSGGGRGETGPGVFAREGTRESAGRVETSPGSAEVDEGGDAGSSTKIVKLREGAMGDFLLLAFAARLRVGGRDCARRRVLEGVSLRSGCGGTLGS